MNKPYENRYCPECFKPVDPVTGAHWHYCDYEAVFAKGRSNPVQLLTELEMLNRKLENAKQGLKRDTKLVHDLQQQIKALKERMAIQEQELLPQAPHCGLCGNRHNGECSPADFDYYQCTKCHAPQKLPFDACFMGGLDGINCGCGANAAEVWQEISLKQYADLTSNQEDDQC
ncbi:hypothetical protein [uncultured Alteromonas sp.]|jgi:hypothetical protein|uniref:hypothetical protein n=1 Tax=uncultured Alteromonas sp. TaxID=179113 RepID=UPI0025D728A2|nr:hypothetical protein [uncultured Alteromonas sp.]